MENKKQQEYFNDIANGRDDEKRCECCGEIKDTNSPFCCDDCEEAFFRPHANPIRKKNGQLFYVIGK